MSPPNGEAAGRAEASTIGHVSRRDAQAGFTVGAKCKTDGKWKTDLITAFGPSKRPLCSLQLGAKFTIKVPTAGPTTNASPFKRQRSIISTPKRPYVSSSTFRSHCSSVLSCEWCNSRSPFWDHSEEAKEITPRANWRGILPSLFGGRDVA
jgi:hypothetical protein